MLSGLEESLNVSSILYTNDGVGNFSEAIDEFFEGVRTSSVAFSDIDGDNDLDVLISGEFISFSGITRLYINDGDGIFSEAVNNPFTEVYSGKVAFADVDGDGDEDVLVTGLMADNTVTHTAKLYLNNGQGVFTELSDCLLYTSPSPRDQRGSRMPSSA